MHNPINLLSIRREAAHPDTNHIKNPFNKLLHLNQSYYQPNPHHPAIPANKVLHPISPVNSLYMFPFHRQARHVIHRKANITAMLIAVVDMFQFHMHQVAEVRHLDTHLTIQHRQVLVVSVEARLVLVEDIPVAKTLDFHDSVWVCLDHKPATV